MKILIAIDGSADGFEATRQAAALLSAARDQVTFFYSAPEVNVDADVALDPAVLARARQALADAVFEEARKCLPADMAARAETILGSGDPRQTITATAERVSADMIVVGARGLSPMASLLLGSVSKSVVHTSRVPVFVARRSPDASAEDILRVLVACDTCEPNGPIADVIRKLSWPPGTVGRAITVVPGMFAGEVPTWLKERTRSPEIEELTRAWVEEHQRELRGTQAKLSAYCEALPAAFHQGAVVVEGHPADKILQEIEREKIDLVIVGAKDRSAIGRFFLGSTSDAVLNQAPCSVLVVRERDTANA